MTRTRKLCQQGCFQETLIRIILTYYMMIHDYLLLFVYYFYYALVSTTLYATRDQRAIHNPHSTTVQTKSEVDHYYGWQLRQESVYGLWRI